MGQSDEKLKLMVVDDEPDNLDLLYRTFRRDFEVLRADSGQTALAQLEQVGEVAVIISDQRMPEMGGIEFLSRTVEQFPDTLRIVLTGYTDVEDLVEAINTGKVFKYITKPWDPEELRVVVRQAAETYRVLKQRTEELNRALQREFLLNAITTAIRESLDVSSILKTLVEIVGRTFGASCCVLRLVELQPQGGVRLSAEAFEYRKPKLLEAAEPEIANLESANSETSPETSSEEPGGCEALAQAAATTLLTQLDASSPLPQQLSVPLIHRTMLLAVLSIYQMDLPRSWRAEDTQLIEVVAQQAALALSQARLYQQTQAQAQQLHSELEVARQIQSNLLRQTWPEIPGLRIQACCYPAQAVGGDFFEVFVHPEGDVWLAVGDVAGKGVPAALFMASLLSVLRREVSQADAGSPDVVLHTLNECLAEDLIGNNRFITMLLARYTPETRELTYASAGHVYPLLWSQADLNGQGKPRYLKARGLPLGILPVWRGTGETLTLEPGQTLLLLSDGVTEASVQGTPLREAFAASALDGQGIGQGVLLEQDGLWHLLRNLAAGAFDLNRLLDQVQAQAGPQEDDQTLLSLEII
ncbi:SpoIIE family protein phosphatase [Leptolyngbya sp. FACHB-261]|uniref:SpoIIE family protein phosphatase n=1 Tax=Leptolyngbya sp. FACHB-261 TaxID=2692806 RepID=UPI001686B220|nr:SpoIIE family protein phosphatase [Leptolyngbya sp. FACHB-261]MBD2099635.1 SpoIIE family protein phosphatase [Leptolyngbya sp. FACHB-261]